MPEQRRTGPAPRIPHPGAASILLGVLLLAALVGAVSRFSEIEEFLALAERMRPGWLVAGLLLQFATYLCEAMSWHACLRRVGQPAPLSALLPLSVAKLFSDQAMPSGGLSGNAFFLGALRRRDVPARDALTCMLIDLVTYFIAYVLMALLSLLVLGWHHALNRWIGTLTAVFVALQLSAPLLVLGLRRHDAFIERITERHLKRLQQAVRLLRDAPAALLVEHGFMARQVLWHALVVLLDTGSLWMMLKGIGQELSPLLVFASFVTASMVSSLSPVPLGLGTFEATCVTMLHGFGIGVEASFTATLLLRGLTVWVPMLPGVWLIRREMGRGRPAARGEASDATEDAAQAAARDEMRRNG